MKGEYVEPKEKGGGDMFSKLHQVQTFNPHHLALTSEETDQATKNDGGSIEVARRPRGRPPGSKNKAKPPLIITRDAEPAMSPYILEIAIGADVVDAVTRFCKRRNTALSILTASGAVANVTLRQPAATPGATVTFHGRFEVLSLSATIFPAASPIGGGFTISLAGPQGQIVGGAVVGPLVAAATVFVVAASFNNPSFHRLPMEEDVRSSGSGGGGNESPVAVSGGDGGGEMSSMYSCHMPTSDAVWAPTARQPPPHYQ